MTPERLREIERLFHEARERPPAERDEWLAHACADDSTLRREVESLLAQPPTGVIDAPLGALVAALVPPPAPQLAPGSSVGPYRIERLLDVGGMGEVYRARDTRLDRDVAIKILPQAFHEPIPNASLASSVRHACSPPSIIRTSAPSTASRKPMAPGRWCSSWWKARR